MQTSLLRIETKKITKSLENMIQNIILNHDLAKIAIRTNDHPKALEVIENDRNIDNQYISIESDLEFLITKAPVDKELRRTLAFLSISRELERIGDYAKHIATFVIKNDKPAKSSVQRIDKIHKAFRKMLLALPDLINQENPNQAQQVAQLDTFVNQEVSNIIRRVISSIANKQDEKKIKERVFVLNVIHSLERAADHVVNICEFIVYIDTGKHIYFD